ncbi:MAG: hypothetical protein Q7K35_03140 [bacterium]|nr:hypothetical protein [bacterium]
MKTSIIKNHRGIELIMTILLMTTIMFLAVYLLDAALIENRIAISQSWGAKTYYLAEAGIQEMVWKLKNDAAYKQNFETNPSWTITFSRTDPFGAGNGSYTVTITNTSLAHGTIISTGTIGLNNGATSQRIVETAVFRAMGQAGIGNNASYADGNVDIALSNIYFHDGGSHSNNVYNIKLLSTVNVDENLNVVNQYIESWLATVNVGGRIYAANDPNKPAAAPIQMPAIDFDSTDANSLKNRATVVYTQAQFDTLMQNNQNLTLNGPITYVDGDINVYGAQTLVVKGLLAAGRDFNLASSRCRGSRCGNSHLTVTRIAGQRSGIFAKRKVNFDLWSGNINITGVVYANDQFNLLSLPLGFTNSITGGLIGRKLTITSVWLPINIYYDNSIINEALGVSSISPVMTVEHWEEEY